MMAWSGEFGGGWVSAHAEKHQSRIDWLRTIVTELPVLSEVCMIIWLGTSVISFAFPAKASLDCIRQGKYSHHCCETIGIQLLSVRPLVHMFDIDVLLLLHRGT